MNIQPIRKWGDPVKLISLAFLSILVFLGFLLPPSASAASLIENASLSKEECLVCHSKANFKITRNGKNISLYVNSDQYSKSIHGTNQCTTCHTGVPTIPHKNTVYGSEQKIQINQRCMSCHLDITPAYNKSIHGAIQKSNQPAAFCSDCHGSHQIMKKENPQSMSFKTNIPHTCTKCHEGEIEESYMESFHGKAVTLGSKKSASCVDCHGSHEILGPNEAASAVSKANTPQTCAKCHLTSRENFANGIEHWVLEKKPGSTPMYYTLKFFTWLTIICISALFVHMELELYRRYKDIKKG